MKKAILFYANSVVGSLFQDIRPMLRLFVESVLLNYKTVHYDIHIIFCMAAICQFLNDKNNHFELHE